MRKPEARTIRRTFLGTWLAAGVLATGYGFLASGCASVPPVPAPVAPAGAIDSLDAAEQAWRAETIAEHAPIWAEEHGPDGDPLVAGIAAFRMASATHDPVWSKRAIDAFERVLEAEPDLALARAWRGAAHALAARDYPVQGLWQIIPGPGFVRLYHVRVAFSDLDSAVSAAPDDPVVRLIRASTRLSMPSIFGVRDEGLADFDVLHAWATDAASNPDFSAVLRSRIWRERYFLARSRALEAVGAREEAARSWQRLSETTDDPTLEELAKWHRISLDASQ